MGKRGWGWGWLASVVVHGTLTGTTLLALRPHYEGVAGPPRDLEGEVIAVAVDLEDEGIESTTPVPVAPAPPEIQATRAQPPRRPAVVRKATIAAPEAAPAASGVAIQSEPVEAPAQPPPAPEPPLAAETAIVPIPRLVGPSPTAAAAPPDLPPSISPREASYLRTYETFPSLPRSLWVLGRKYHVLVEVCVTDGGRVAGVQVRSGATPELDRTLVSAMRSWRYRPYIVGGSARPFCHLMKMEYSLRS